MALSNLSFAAAGTGYLSSEYVPATSNLSVGVKFASRPGAAVVERSIDGVNWAVAGMMASAANDSFYVLMNVCGFVVGETFRVRVDSEPESIHVLEAD